MASIFFVGTPSELLQDIQQLTDNLVKSESHLKETIAKNMKVQIDSVISLVLINRRCLFITIVFLIV